MFGFIKKKQSREIFAFLIPKILELGTGRMR